LHAERPELAGLDMLRTQSRLSAHRLANGTG
jgi:hypothetical protein